MERFQGMEKGKPTGNGNEKRKWKAYGGREGKSCGEGKGIESLRGWEWRLGELQRGGSEDSQESYNRRVHRRGLYHSSNDDDDDDHEDVSDDNDDDEDDDNDDDQDDVDDEDDHDDDDDAEDHDDDDDSNEAERLQTPQE